MHRAAVLSCSCSRWSLKAFLSLLFSRLCATSSSLCAVSSSSRFLATFSLFWTSPSILSSTPFASSILYSRQKQKTFGKGDGEILTWRDDPASPGDRLAVDVASR